MLQVSKFVRIDSNNHYMQMIRNTWGARLKQVFQEIPDPTWRDAGAAPDAPGQATLTVDLRERPLAGAPVPVSGPGAKTRRFSGASGSTA